MNRDKPRLVMSKKAVLTLTAIILALAALVGSTIAYLMDTSGTMSSIGVAPIVPVNVEIGSETGPYPTPGPEPLPSGYTPPDMPTLLVSNDYAYPIYARVKFNAVWKNGDETVDAVQGRDYAIGFWGWEKATDGFWYYTDPIEAGDGSSYIFLEVQENSDYYQLGYKLEFNVISYAGVRADDHNIVLRAFSSGVSGVDDYGTLIIKTEQIGGEG